MTAASNVPATAEGTARQDRLAAAVARLRTRAGTADLQRWLLIGGGVLLPLGLLLIVLGWVGAANTPRLFEQIPYMISGGLLGLGLVFFGGFLYFAYWMTRMVQESREQSARLTDALNRMEERLAGGPAAAAGVSERLVATKTGKLVHTPDCPMVAGRKGLRTVPAGARGMQPCRVCQPE